MGADRASGRRALVGMVLFRQAGFQRPRAGRCPHSTDDGRLRVVLIAFLLNPFARALYIAAETLGRVAGGQDKRRDQHAGKQEHLDETSHGKLRIAGHRAGCTRHKPFGWARQPLARCYMAMLMSVYNLRFNIAVSRITWNIRNIPCHICYSLFGRAGRLLERPIAPGVPARPDSSRPGMAILNNSPPTLVSSAYRSHIQIESSGSS